METKIEAEAMQSRLSRHNILAGTPCLRALRLSSKNEVVHRKDGK